MQLADHVVRLWRRSVTLGEQGEETITYRLAVAAPDYPNARVNRSTTRVARDGPGLTPIGTRRLYMDAATDLRQRDLVDLVEGPEAPALLEVDSEVVRPRGNHLQVDCRPYKGEQPSAGRYFLQRTITFALPPVRVVRGPGTTPYVAGMVFGDAADARLSFDVPPLPPSMFATNLPAFGYDLVMHRHAQDVVAGNVFMPVLRRGAFVTVLGDQDPLVLEDEDVDAVVGDVQAQSPQTTTVILRAAAGGMGRFQVQANSLVVLERGVQFERGGTVSLYLMLSDQVTTFGPTYTPLPYEALMLYPRFLVQGHTYHDGPEA